jgi:hypothetical protein
VIDGPRFTVAQMRRRDWVLLSACLPKEADCNELQQGIRWLAWGQGRCRPARLRQIRSGLARGPCIVGPFRFQREGRWGFVIVLDQQYGLSRTRRNRRVPRSEVGVLDAMYRRRSGKEARLEPVGPTELANV